MLTKLANYPVAIAAIVSIHLPCLIAPIKPVEASSFTSTSQATLFNRDGVNLGQSFNNTADNPILFSANISNQNGSASARSYAGFGVLKAEYQAYALANQVDARAFAGAAFTLDDLVFSGTSTLRTITTSLNLTMDGNFDSTGAPSNPFPSNFVSIGLGFKWGSSFDGVTAQGRISRVNGEVFREGLLANYDSNIYNLITTPQFTFDPSKPQSVSLSLGLQGQAIERNNTPAFSVANFFNTLSFAQSGNVFNLPEGWTVNSKDGQIVNNRFVGLQPRPVPIGGGFIGIAIAGAFLSKKLAFRSTSRKINNLIGG
jgi:hypothetical protein